MPVIKSRDSTWNFATTWILTICPIHRSRQPGKWRTRVIIIFSPIPRCSAINLLKLIHSLTAAETPQLWLGVISLINSTLHTVLLKNKMYAQFYARQVPLSTYKIFTIKRLNICPRTTRRMTTAKNHNKSPCPFPYIYFFYCLSNNKNVLQECDYRCPLRRDHFCGLEPFPRCTQIF